MYHMWVMLPNVSIGEIQQHGNARVPEIFAQTLGNGFGGDMMKTLRGEHGRRTARGQFAAVQHARQT